MSPKPIDDLAIMIDNLYYPLLTNPLNQKGWPETMSKDMEMHLQELRNTIAEVSGSHLWPIFTVVSNHIRFDMTSIKKASTLESNNWLKRILMWSFLIWTTFELKQAFYGLMIVSFLPRTVMDTWTTKIAFFHPNEKCLKLLNFHTSTHRCAAT